MLLIICAILSIILITFFIENGDLGWSTVVFFAFAAIVIFIDKTVTWDDIKFFVSENTGMLVLIGFIYVAMGILWSILKWKWFCSDQYEKMMSRGASTSKYTSPYISASYHTSRITGWMLWWPLSLAWFALHDPITKFYKFLYRKLASTFESISKSTYDTMRKRTE